MSQAMFIDFGLAKDRDGGCYLRCAFFILFVYYIVSEPVSLRLKVIEVLHMEMKHLRVVYLCVQHFGYTRIFKFTFIS